MNTPCMSCTLTLSRPWPQRWLAAATERLRSAWHAEAQAHAAAAQPQRHVWDLDSAAGLSDRTLRDIGAPDWLRVEAAARREADHVSAVGLRDGGSGLFGRTW